MGAVRGKSYVYLLIDTPLVPHATSYSLEHLLLSICFMLGAAFVQCLMYSSQYPFSIGYIFIILQVKKMRLSLSD